MNGDEPLPDLGARWAELARLTPARIGLGRSGSCLPTRELLRFGLAHARARDAVHAPFSPDAIATELAALGLSPIAIASAAPSRAAYLRRPDLGRIVPTQTLATLTARAGVFDLAIVVADGLSAAAVHRNAAGLIAALLPLLARRGLALAPVAIASQARVALGDAVAAALGARAVLVLIGERPGLSAPDSLGAYLTFAPREGTTDAMRNCVSNIRPEGLPHEPAAFRIDWLTGQALRRGLTGVDLKDDSDLVLAAAAERPRLV